MGNLFNQNLLNLLKDFDSLLSEGEILKARNLLDEIQKFDRFCNIKLKKTLNKNSKGIILNSDPSLENINIEEKVRQFFDKIENIFGEYILDEVAILRCTGNDIIPVYFYSINIDRINEDNINDSKVNEFKSQLINEMQFFIENIINKGGLEDGEGTLSGSSLGGAFDAVLRIGDHIYGFNNSTESLETLKHKHNLDQNKLVHEISKFFYDIK